jgi:hypothetical protein
MLEAWPNGPSSVQMQMWAAQAPAFGSGSALRREQEWLPELSPEDLAEIRAAEEAREADIAARRRESEDRERRINDCSACSDNLKRQAELNARHRELRRQEPPEPEAEPTLELVRPHWRRDFGVLEPVILLVLALVISSLVLVLAFGRSFPAAAALVGGVGFMWFCIAAELHYGFADHRRKVQEFRNELAYFERAVAARAVQAADRPRQKAERHAFETQLRDCGGEIYRLRAAIKEHDQDGHQSS